MQINSRVQDFIVHACLLMASVEDQAGPEAAELRGTIFGASDVLRICQCQGLERIEVLRDFLLSDPAGTWEELVEQAGPFQLEKLRELLLLAPPGAQQGETYRVLAEWLESSEVQGMLQ